MSFPSSSFLRFSPLLYFWHLWSLMCLLSPLLSARLSMRLLFGGNELLPCGGKFYPPLRSSLHSYNRALLINSMRYLSSARWLCVYVCLGLRSLACLCVCVCACIWDVLVCVCVGVCVCVSGCACVSVDLGVGVCLCVHLRRLR